MAANDEVVLEASDLHKTFVTGKLGLGRARVSAVDGVSLTLRRDETVGIVGESGSGKSTLARMLVGLERADSGSIRYRGTDVALARGKERMRLRERVQMVFQDPYASLDPRMTVFEIVAEPLRVHRRVKGQGSGRYRDRVTELLGLVGLSTDVMSRHPHQFSGGQRQRIGIARALALEPEVLVCDEPVSALDVSVQAQIVNLLYGLQHSLGMAIVFIGHDLSVVRQVSDRVCVMYLGRLAEQGDTAAIFDGPAHPYTQALLSASPVVDRGRRGRLGSRILLKGDPPSPAEPPAGCRFHTRCRMAAEICGTETPALRSVEAHPSGVRQVACHFAEDALTRLDEVFPGSRVIDGQADPSKS